ncbi:hypothetical protein Tco_0571790 [Tanacetum coccineum]
MLAESLNPQETQQVAARDETWVPFTERVNINSIHVKLETTVPQKEETFQFSIKKVQGTDSYEFLLANKKCVVNADVFRTILDICPRVEGMNFTDVPDDDTTLAFLIKLGYKGPLYKHTNMFVDRMHQPWRTLAAIINKCLSGKTSSNDKLYLAYHIDHIREKISSRENMPFPQFTKATVDVSEESKPEPGLVKRKTSSMRRVKKKVTLSADDNIISDDPDTALELGKSISQTEAEEAEATRQVHATHARIMTESVPESAKKKSGGRSSKSVVIQDTPSAPKSKPATSKTKLKGASSLTLEEQEDTDIIQALKESKKRSKRQPGTGGSNEGIGTIPGVPNESTVISATSSEGTEEDKLGDEEKDDKDDDADDEGNAYVRDDQDVDDEDAETESGEDDIYKYKIRVRKDEDEEMLNAEVDDSDKVDEEVTNAAKVDDVKTSEVKDDAKKTELPPSSSSLSVSLDAEINSLLEVKIQSEVLLTQCLSILSVPVYVISEPIVLTPVQESPLKATVTTLPPPFISTTPHLRVAKLEKDMYDFKKIDLSAEALAALKIQVPSVVDNYLRSKVGDVFQKELKKHTAYLIQKYSLQQILELPKK